MITKRPSEIGAPRIVDVTDADRKFCCERKLGIRVEPVS